MKNAADSRRLYPGVVASFSKAQIASGAHRSALVSRAKLRADLISSNPPRFGGRC